MEGNYEKLRWPEKTNTGVGIQTASEHFTLIRSVADTMVADALLNSVISTANG